MRSVIVCALLQAVLMQEDMHCSVTSNQGVKNPKQTKKSPINGKTLRGIQKDMTALFQQFSIFHAWIPFRNQEKAAMPYNGRYGGSMKEIQYFLLFPVLPSKFPVSLVVSCSKLWTQWKLQCLSGLLIALCDCLVFKFHYHNILLQITCMKNAEVLGF